MDRDCVAQNLAVVESHFHSEALNEVEVALETFTDDFVWEAPQPDPFLPSSRNIQNLPA